MRDLLAQLEEAIIATTMELMACGGTTPPQTHEVLLEDYPDLCRLFAEQEIVTRCERIQQAEIPEESERFQELFRTFNVRSFGGRLPPYRVHVVYDVNFWANEYFFNGFFLEEFSLGYIDLENRRIFVRRSEPSLSEPSMAGVLLHEMGHAATTDDHDDEWLAEMRRLLELGAPVLPGDVEPGIPTHDDPIQLKLDLVKVRTSEEIFRKVNLPKAACSVESRFLRK